MNQSMIKDRVVFRPNLDTREKMKILLKDFPRDYPSVSLLCRAGIQALFRERIRLLREEESDKDKLIREKYSQVGGKNL